jgi:hypothetical protein
VELKKNCEKRVGPYESGSEFAQVRILDRTAPGLERIGGRKSPTQKSDAKVRRKSLAADERKQPLLDDPCDRFAEGNWVCGSLAGSVRMAESGSGLPRSRGDE